MASPEPMTAKEYAVAYEAWVDSGPEKPVFDHSSISAYVTLVAKDELAVILSNERCSLTLSEGEARALGEWLTKVVPPEVLP